MYKLFMFCAVLLCSVSMAEAQTRSVSGKVTSETGESLVGVSVILKGSKVGTFSDDNGKYVINVPQGDAILVFSSIGFKTEEKTVTGSTADVVLVEEIKGLEDVVITAMAITKDVRALGYSTEKVGGEELQSSSEPNVIQGLSSKAAGVQVIGSGGAAGSASYIRIRGNATFTSNDNQPLIVVDGIPIDNSQNATEDLRAGVALSNRAIDLNSADIEDVTVLKGGAAAALYGTRGANGVILVTTKKGALNKPFTVEFSSSLELLKVNKLPALQTQYGQGLGGYSGFGTPTAAFSWGPKISELGYDADGNITDDESVMVGGTKGTVPAINNAEDFFQTGYRSNTNLSISGGSAKNTYYLSIGNSSETGIIPLNSFNRTSVRTTGTAQVTDKLKMTSSLSFTNSGGRRIQQGSNTSGLMLGLLRTTPSFDASNGSDDPEDPSAYLNQDGTQRRYHASYDNPYWTINNNPFEDNVNRLQGFVQADYKFSDWLSFMYRFGTDNYTDRRTQVLALQSRTAVNGRIIEDVYTYSEYNSDLIATANKDFGAIASSLMVGWNVNQRNKDNVYATGDGYSLEGFNNLSNASTIQAGQGVSRRRLAGVYSELNLGYADQYFLTATARGDKASTFGDVSTIIFYPSVSGSWVFSETFGLSNSVFSFGKLRASYAKVGLEPSFGSNRNYFNQAGSSSGWIDGVSFPFGNVTGFTQSNVLGNPDLRPEFTETVEFGVDMRLFRGRLNVDLTWYNQQSKDLIVAVPISGASGFNSSFQNIGQMENKGIELNINGTIIKKKDFRWDAGAVLTRYRNKVISLAPGVDVISLPWGFSGANQRLVKDEAYGTLYGDDWERDADGNALVDADGYPIYSPTEVVVGNPNPDWLLGANSTISYKNFTFSMLWDIRRGGDIWNGTRGALYYFGTHQDVAEDREGTQVWEDVVQGNSGVYAPGTEIDGVDVSGQPNTTPIPNDWRAYAAGPLSGFTGASRPFIEDGSWVRLRSVSITYDFPSSMFEGKSIKGFNVGVSGRNLLLFTNYTGIDPETNLSGTTNSQGADYFNMPNTRGIIFSLRATF